MVRKSSEGPHRKGPLTKKATKREGRSREKDTPAEKGRREDRSGVPSSVCRAYERGLWVIPRVFNSRAGRYHPPFKWKRYKDIRPTWAEVVRWSKQRPTALWAVVTGHEVIVLDFDVPEGLVTMHRLGLRPHIISPSGGAHVYVIAPPGELVRGAARVDPRNFPGMDLLAYGQTATFKGSRHDGSYRPSRDAPPIGDVDDLPRELQRLIRRRQFKKRDLERPNPPDGFADFISVTSLLGDALRRAESKGRNDSGFWLACQLRDEARSFEETEETLLQYQSIVSSNGSHRYAPQEAYDSVVSAYSQPPRLPRLLREDAVVELFSEVQTKPLEWLWPGRVPAYKITIIEGDPERGKSTVGLDVGARVTRGQAMPGEVRGNTPAAVLVISAEDDIEDTVKPRLKAAGANMKRIGYIKLRRGPNGRVVPLAIPDDLDRIERAIDEEAKRTGLPVKLVIIDPITAYLSDRINTSNDAQVRRAMLPLKQLAEEKRTTVILVRHLNKDSSLRAMYRGGGSIAFTASARSVLVAERHPDHRDVLVLARVKSNLAAAIRPITYRIVFDARFDAARIEWGESINIDVNDLLRGSDGRTEAPARKEAEIFLRDFLADGPKESADVERAANAAGHTVRTIKNAKRRLRVRSRAERDKNGKIIGWRWSLPIYVEGSTTLHFDLEE
jgi:hypothetical protein